MTIKGYCKWLEKHDLSIATYNSSILYEGRRCKYFIHYKKRWTVAGFSSQSYMPNIFDRINILWQVYKIKRANQLSNELSSNDLID